MDNVKELEKQSIKIRRALKICSGLEKRKTLNTEFTDAKSIEEANNWAVKNLGIEQVDYSRFDLRIANRVNKQLKVLQEMYPSIRNIKYIGAIEDTLPEYIKYIVKVADDKHNLSDSERMFVTRGIIRANKFNSLEYVNSTSEVYGKYQGLWFRGSWVKNLEKLENSLSEDSRYALTLRWGNTIEGIVTHEFCHQIQYYLSEQKIDAFVFDFWDTLNKRETKRTKYRISRAVSSCGARDIGEFFAELMTEYILSPNPRPLALEMGKRVDAALLVHRNNFNIVKNNI